LNAQDLPTAKWENINYAGNNEVHHIMDIYLPNQEQTKKMFAPKNIDIMVDFILKEYQKNK
ncbi:MAG: hypothetical protein L7U59_05505, partial [Flavobacteriaceae bacterium]|nr:hypothetical protein [Flavobacteriaceae bacterium]